MLLLCMGLHRKWLWPTLMAAWWYAWLRTCSWRHGIVSQSLEAAPTLVLHVQGAVVSEETAGCACVSPSTAALTASGLEPSSYPP